MNNRWQWMAVLSFVTFPAAHAATDVIRVPIQWEGAGERDFISTSQSHSESAQSETTVSVSAEREARIGFALSSWAPPTTWSAAGSQGFTGGTVPSVSAWGSMAARNFRAGTLRGFAGVRYASWQRAGAVEFSTTAYEFAQQAQVLSGRGGVEFLPALISGPVSAWIRPVLSAFVEPTIALFPRSVAGSALSLGGILMGASVFAESELGGRLPLNGSLMLGAEWRGGWLGGEFLAGAPAIWGGLGVKL